jgi:hypothetical protein
LTEYPVKWITGNFKGPFTDYEPMWYSAVGFLILKTMIINAILPMVMTVMGFALPWIKRKKDMKWGNDRYVT